MIGKLREILKLSNGDWIVSFTTKLDPRALFDQLKDLPVLIDIRKASKARSKSANDLCWAMCTDIGKAIYPPLPKEEVYRTAIRDVGEYEPLPIREKALPTFQKRWSSKGIGWFVDVVDDSKLKGYKLVFAYYGSSTYDVESMGRLIEYLKQEMRNLNLQIPISKEEEERLLRKWKA